MTAVLLLVALAALGSAQQLSTPYVSGQPHSTSDTTASYHATATTTTGHATSAAIALPSVPFTGQALIVGTLVYSHSLAQTFRD